MVQVLLTSCCIKYVIISVLFCDGFKAQASLDCNFDDDVGDSFCGWTQDKSDDFDWSRHSGGSPSFSTGPYSDHTTGVNGHYIYIEASDQMNGDKARLRSPVQNPGISCFMFWYNMYGRDIAELNVYMKLSGGSETLLFRRDKKVDNRDWKKAMINSNANDTYQILIEGVRGGDTKGDIAVDDISMVHEWCPVDCDFDNGFCNWIQEDRDDFDWELGTGLTGTRHTGPETDHTSGNGQYAYINSSSADAAEKALLVSPIQNAGTYCFSFWYYMYGEDVETLRVLQRNEQGTQLEIFTDSGNIGQRWVLARLVLRSSAHFKITFEGSVRNKQYWLRNNGDIAVDDMQMLPCQDCDNPTSEHAITNSTNFEYGSVIKVTCETGYELLGESLLVCKTNGSWSASIPLCKLIDCGNRTLSNGNFSTPEGTTFGQTASHVCNTGYTLIGDKTVNCTASGWSGTTTTCEITDAVNSALVAVYVSVPVTVTFLIALLIIFLFRKGALTCKKLTEVKNESRRNTVFFPNQTYSTQKPEKLNISVHQKSGESVQLNSEYETIKK